MTTAGHAPALAERLIQAAVDYESGRCSSRELAEARAAVESAIPAPAQPTRDQELEAEVSRLRERLELLAVGFDVPDGGKYIADWQARIKKYRALAAQPPAAPVETATKSAPGSSAPHNTGERPPSSDAADTGADTQCSAGNGGTPRDWFGDLNERVGKGLNAPLEPSAGQAEAIPEGFVSVELLQIARATADRLREENAILRASNKSIFSAIDASEDRLRSVEDLRMGDVAMEFRRLRETLFAKSDLAKGPNTERQASSAGNGDAWPPLKMALWRVLMDEKLNDGHYIAAFEFIEKLYAAVAPHVQRQIKFEVEDYVRDYEFRGDGGDYKPTEAEQEVLIDAIHGAIHQLEQRIPTEPQPTGTAAYWKERHDLVLRKHIECCGQVGAATREALEIAEDVLSRSPYSTAIWPNGMHPNTGIEKIRAALALTRPPLGGEK